ncbi:MAG TPA: hypothetical protein DCG46_02615 [Gammaproteobacteria bacterium]|jgi:hypothetical protein|nr:hypothetical protein [Gammaproteobacteria bacterium]HAE70474.1 hypothetical protein [Gammaproteobacteria bacterium]HAG48002.1 hypothetical protein [Gammaproteobacteria bacterium]HAO45259.1 hypothetical protein [Gammaproteobacteria bacterium]HAO53014.1 hypothetical protein [Gammaproteobacteria bacterium]
MFTNTVTATIEFDYQGQHYDLKTVIDIDHIIHHEDFFNSVYTSIARANDIGTYSYQLEVMLDQEINFSNEKGCVVGCVNNGNLNLDLLRESYQKAECVPKVELIMHKHFTKDQYSEQIIQALMEAYLEGK